MIFIGADHRGFELKETIKDYLKSKGEAFEDLGDKELDPDDDYPVFAKRVAERVSGDREGRGILICGSGAGVDMVANKVNGVRCALVFDEARARQAREHENANIIALPADALESSEALKIIEAFLETGFSGEERHLRRLEEMEEIEKDS